MKDGKNRLLWADRVRVTFIVAIAFCSMLAVGGRETAVLIVELVLLALFLLAEFSLNRCCHCDRYLDRNRGPFCQHCGGRIREDKPDT